MVSLPGQALATQTLSIKGREERVKGDESDVIICAFSRDRIEESLPLPREEEKTEKKIQRRRRPKKKKKKKNNNNNNKTEKKKTEKKKRRRRPRRLRRPSKAT